MLVFATSGSQLTPEAIECAVDVSDVLWHVGEQAIVRGSEFDYKISHVRPQVFSVTPQEKEQM